MTGDEQGALDRLVEAQDWVGVVAVLDSRWSELLDAEPQALRRAINALPAHVLAENPRWAHAVEYVNRFVAHDGPRATRFRGTAAAPAPRSLLDLLAQLTSRAAAARANGRLDEAVAAAREARAAVDEATGDAREQLAQALPELEFQWAMVWEYAGDLEAAVREYSECYDHAVLIDHVIMQTRAAGSLAWLHALAGRNLQARRWLARLPEAGGEWWQSRASITAVFARTLMLIDELRYDDARASLAEADLTGVTERWPAQKLLAALLHPDAETALDLLTQIDASAASQPEALRTDGAAAAFVGIARAMLLRTLGNRAGARAALEGLRFGEASLVAQLVTIIAAQDAAESGDRIAAGRRVAPLLTASAATPRVLASAYALVASAALHDADAPAARADAGSAFRLALELARTHTLYQPLLVLSRADLRALFAVMAGTAVPDALADALLANSRDTEPDPFTALTPRERTVLSSVLAGRSTAAIAESLFVSPNTVKTQLRSIYRKIGVRNRRDLERAAHSAGHSG